MTPQRLKSSWHGVGHAAVAIGKVGAAPFNTHVGVIYMGPEGELHVLDLGFHYDLRDSKYNKMYMAAIPKIRPERARSVAALCRLIWKRHKQVQGVPFSLQLDKEIRFNLITGDIVLSKGGHGLNCSNFVIVVFLQNGIDLIDYSTWEERPEDEEWQKYLVKILVKKGASPEHVAAVREEIGCARVRPEEVAGACLEDNWPVAFAECQRNGIHVKTAVDQRFATPKPTGPKR